MIRRRDHDDSGATLILVLVIITAISAVMSVVLAVTDTAERTTVALRDQASDNYSADAATQAMLNKLQTSNLNCNDPANPDGATLGSTASPFYVPGSSVQGPINAYAQCTPDAIQGKTVTTSTPPAQTAVNTVIPAPVTVTSPVLGAGDPTLPTYALLATGTAPVDYGIDFSSSASGRVACIENGSVASNRNINILKPGSPPSGQTLAVRLSPSVTGSGTASPCTSGTGVDPKTGSKLLVTAAGNCQALAASNFAPTACTSGAATVTTPDAPPLPGPIAATNPAPVCYSGTMKNKAVTFAAYLPGMYTDANVLTTPSSSTCTTLASTVVEWLSPGAYYLNFAAGTTWTLPNIMVAGTPIDTNGNPITSLQPTVQSTLTALANMGAAPAACQDADPNKSNGYVQGAELIFAGASTITAANSGNSNAQTAEICASSPTNSPPVAIYGASLDNQTVPLSSGGSASIPAQSLCTTDSCGSTSFIKTDTSGQATMYFKGYVYAPKAQLDLTLKNSTAQVFNWGVIVRDFRFVLNGSSPDTPFLQLPKPNTGAGLTVTTSTPPPIVSTTVTQPPPVPITSYSVRYVNVWTCTVASLQASGRTSCPSNGAPSVQAKVLTDGTSLRVLSWNHVG